MSFFLTALRRPGAPSSLGQQVRFRSQLAPRQIKWVKRHRGVTPIPTGGSTKGTTLAFGEYGIRIRSEGVRLTAKQLTSVEEVLKRKLKPLKGAQIWMRVFPDIPVCVKGNETRMGRGKGLFEYWATRVNTGRVIFEIGGIPIREELAREALRQAAAKMPCVMEFITRQTPPRLGNLDIIPDGFIMRSGRLMPIPPPASASTPTVAAQIAQLTAAAA
ncbi:ribosomal protein L16 [Exidia glandulosa HHB12029]|uniref:Ribosomal protein L16 n=1 Tax=Exidia glandulosa HHB12029 TaxID=1314781 RepID=A0A165ZBB1_EXIGL|nr:ribosomal protein L16 [Exidia glandulosa HHB12029]